MFNDNLLTFSHNMKAFGHSKSSKITIYPTYLFIWKNKLLWVSVQPPGVFS